MLHLCVKVFWVCFPSEQLRHSASQRGRGRDEELMKLRETMLHLQLQNAKLQQQLQDDRVVPASVASMRPAGDAEMDDGTDAEAAEAASKPVESKPVESKPVESKPEPVERKPVERKPVESKPVESKPVERKPVDSKAVRMSRSSPAVDPSQLETQVIPPTQPSPEHCPTPSPSAVPEDDELDGEELSEECEAEKETKLFLPPRAVDADEAMAVDSEFEERAAEDSLRQEEAAAMAVLQQAQQRLEVLRAQQSRPASSRAKGSAVIVETREGLLKAVEPTTNHKLISAAIRRVKRHRSLNATLAPPAPPG